MSKQFPKQVFEDVEPSDFGKYNKKGVSEDFVTENFKDLGWSCFRPFDDTGVDLVARKKICKKNHTKWNKIETKSKCSKCGDNLITITRFIQIKTREVDEKGIVGYTLDSADFRADPRHTMLIYSDATLDFLILPINEYLKFFNDNQEAGAGHFGTPSFRYENNKVNNLLVSKENGTEEYSWSYQKDMVEEKVNKKTGKKIKIPKKKSVKVSWAPYLNDKGLEKLSNPLFEKDFKNLTTTIAKMKIELIHNYRPGQEIQGGKKCVVPKKQDDLTEDDKKKIKLYESKVKRCLKKKNSMTASEIVEMRQKNKKMLWENIKTNKELVGSIRKAWDRFKDLDIESCGDKKKAA